MTEFEKKLNEQRGMLYGLNHAVLGYYGFWLAAWAWHLNNVSNAFNDKLNERLK